MNHYIKVNTYVISHSIDVKWVKQKQEWGSQSQKASIPMGIQQTDPAAGPIGISIGKSSYY